ncbi:MAG: hypothetical protein ACJ8DI_22145 [Ktedonobacteraceae bacterium]
MTIPIQIGVPQLILFIVGLVGLGLLISSVMSLAGRGAGRYRDFEDEEEARKFGRPRRYRYHRRFRWRRGFSGVILLLIAISLLWLTFLVQTYLGLTGNIKVARVHATSVANVPHLMSVDLTLYDQNGHQTSDKTYVVNGDEWMLQGDIIKFPTWVNILGLHSGYKLTRLEGRYDDPKLESNSRHVVVTLNGGDDNFFKAMQGQAWVSPVIQAAYGNAVFLMADGKSYDVFVSQTGLYATPEK